MATADEEAGGFFGARWLLQNRPEVFEGVGYLANEGGSAMLLDEVTAFNIEVNQKVPLWLRLTARDMPVHGSAPRVTSSVKRISGPVPELRISNSNEEPYQRSRLTFLLSRHFRMVRARQ
jgi:hypothetical protein